MGFNSGFKELIIVSIWRYIVWAAVNTVKQSTHHTLYSCVCLPLEPTHLSHCNDCMYSELFLFFTAKLYRCVRICESVVFRFFLTSHIETAVELKPTAQRCKSNLQNTTRT